MNTPASASVDPRARQARDWALSSLGLADAQFAPASADASFRRYFRLSDAGRSWIVMDAPPQQENCRPFLHVARLLAAWGLHVPGIVAEDLGQGFLLLTDLGTQTFLHVLTPDNADGLFEDALSALVRMQVAAASDPRAAALPPYDAALLERETQLFPDWYLARHLKVSLAAADAADLAAATATLVQSALAQPRTFVHRDYMPRNLMISRPNPGILDFQDAVHGPITYDAVCLFRDAFLSWPAERVREWLRQYWSKAKAAHLPVPADFAEFMRSAEWMGLQRHLKVLGIFARLTHRDGKPHYVADTPRFVRYVMDVAPRHPELAPLTRLFERHVLPAVPL